MAGSKVLINCRYCNVGFFVKFSDSGCSRYCSRPCYYRFRRERYSLRFWEAVEKTEGCWLWKIGKDKRGYGIFNSRGRSYRAHRVAFELSHGEVPNGLRVLHKCDNPPCVNPIHLYAGTDADNMRDRKERKHHQYGVFHHKAILNDDSVREIRKRYDEGGVTQVELGRQFGTDKTTIYMVVHRKTWKHID